MYELPPPKETGPRLDVAIRWHIRRDAPEVLKIERESFEFPWSDEDFLLVQRQRNCISMVAEFDHQIVGYMLYELQKSRLNILNFAVAAEFRRNKLGTKMVGWLVDKLSQQRRNELVVEVRERNLGAQLFFKSQRFRAVIVLRNHYDDTDEDAYIMQYRLDEPPHQSHPYRVQNRIAPLFP